MKTDHRAAGQWKAAPLALLSRNQGRQEHGWFGDGTSPKDDINTTPQDGANPLFDPANAAQRVDYAAHGIIMYVPRNERGRWNAY